jgi:hypothetical protein
LGQLGICGRLALARPECVVRRLSRRHSEDARQAVAKHDVERLTTSILGC